ncbi:MAG: VOC family protein [Ginsengibacter sp.]
MIVVNPYVNFDGNTEEAFDFYKSVFGGEFSLLMRMKDAPGMDISEDQKEKIMHIALPLSSGQVLMGSDAACQKKEGAGVNNCNISIHAESIEEGQKLFDQMSGGGSNIMPYEKQFWGAWHGHFTDKFGIGWMINYDHPENQ